MAAVNSAATPKQTGQRLQTDRKGKTNLSVIGLLSHKCHLFSMVLKWSLQHACRDVLVFLSFSTESSNCMEQSVCSRHVLDVCFWKREAERIFLHFALCCFTLNSLHQHQKLTTVTVIHTWLLCSLSAATKKLVEVHLNITTSESLMHK